MQVAQCGPMACSSAPSSLRVTPCNGLLCLDSDCLQGIVQCLARIDMRALMRLRSVCLELQSAVANLARCHEEPTMHLLTGCLISRPKSLAGKQNYTLRRLFSLSSVTPTTAYVCCLCGGEVFGILTCACQYVIPRSASSRRSDTRE